MDLGLKTRLDYDDYRAIPVDGKRWELIDGEAHVTPAPSPFDQRLVLRFARALQDQLAQEMEVFVAPVDVILSPHDVLQPDLVVVANPAQVSERGVEGAPSLVIEILSPATTIYDRTTKSQRYAAFGIPHYWIVDPMTRSLEGYRLDGSIYRLIVSAGSDGVPRHPDFPRLELSLTALWS